MSQTVEKVRLRVLETVGSYLISNAFPVFSWKCFHLRTNFVKIIQAANTELTKLMRTSKCFLRTSNVDLYTTTMCHNLIYYRNAAGQEGCSIFKDGELVFCEALNATH